MSPVPTLDLPGLPPLPVLHTDARCLALLKPAGLACTAADAPPGTPNLESLIETALAAGAPWATERGIRVLRIIRPLDPEVGGVLLLSRGAPGSRLAFAQALEERRAITEFLAVVGGKPPKRRWMSCLKIRPDPADPTRVLTHTRQGQFAETEFEVLAYGDGMTLVIARPRTFRRHQIRAHLAAIGLPILGDTLYGFGRNAPIKRHGILPRLDPDAARNRPLHLALLAYRLAFQCPFTREPLDLHVPVEPFLADYGFDVAEAAGEEEESG